MHLLELSRGSDPPDELSSPNRAHPFLGVIQKRSKNFRRKQRGDGVRAQPRQLDLGPRPWEVDRMRRELRTQGVPVPLGGRAFEIVEVLAQSAGELFTKDEII